jgi:hypothetical protein
MSLRALSDFADRHSGVLLALAGAMGIFETVVMSRAYGEKKNKSRFDWFAIIFSWINVVFISFFALALLIAPPLFYPHELASIAAQRAAAAAQ